MKNNLKAIFSLLTLITAIGGLCLLICTMIYTTFVHEHDPKDLIITSVYLSWISGCFYIIRIIIGEDKISTSICPDCFYNECKCNRKYHSVCGCNNCDAKHYVGDEVRYDKNYNTFCVDCSDGISTIGGTTLEECWFDADVDDEHEHNDYPYGGSAPNDYING